MVIGPDHFPFQSIAGHETEVVYLPASRGIFFYRSPQYPISRDCQLDPSRISFTRFSVMEKSLEAIHQGHDALFGVESACEKNVEFVIVFTA